MAQRRAIGYGARMTLRLVLVMLLALFAAPAMAQSCHDDAPRQAAHVAHHASPGQHHDHHRREPAAIHACIGCIPPASLRVAAVDAQRVVPPLPRIIAIDAFVAGLSAPPALPPPRLG